MEKFTAYITKYALTEGIQEINDAEQATDVPQIITWQRSYRQSCYGENRDWHRTKEGALKRAEEMRVKKITSLKKSIIKLEKMTFL